MKSLDEKKKYREEYRKRNREKFREYQRTYALKNPEKIKEIDRNWRKNNTDKKKSWWAVNGHKYGRTYRGYVPHPRVRKKYLTSEEETKKRKARVLAQTAVKNGTIRRFPCIFCGSNKTQMHHADYSKPLDVIWVCRKHHMDIHYKGITIPSLVAS